MLIRNQTSPRLLQEIHNFDPRWGPSRLFEDAHPHSQSEWCSHVYATNTDRSIIPEPNSRPKPGVTWRVAATCQKCRSHVDLVLSYDQDCTNPCPVEDHPFHHFIYSGGSLAEPGDEGGEGIYQFKCSSPTCQVDLTLQCQRPILNFKDVTHFIFPYDIHARLREARKVHGNDKVPSRNAAESLRVFRLSVEDALKGSARTIPAGNPTFMSVFGNTSGDLLERLEFSFDPPTRDRGGSWTAPTPLPHSAEGAGDPTRSTLEDVRDEIHVLITGRPAHEKEKTKEGPFEIRYAQLDFARVLGIPLNLLAGSAEENILPTLAPFAQPIPSFYRDLGIVSNFPMRHVSWAHDQQLQADYVNGPRYLDALRQVAREKGSEELQIEVATRESLALETQTTNDKTISIEEAYRIIGIEPEHLKFLQDDHILTKYHSFSGPANAQEQTLRSEALKVIGKQRKSEAIVAAAAKDRPVAMTYEQALAFLDAQATTQDEFIMSLVSVKLAEDTSLEDQARQAVQVIADYRNSDYLHTELAGTAPVRQMDKERAHRLLGIDVGGDLDSQHLITQYEMNSKDQPGRSAELREALEVVAQSRNNEELTNYLRYLPPTIQLSEDIPAQEPRGLNNIGNTCYLASLLQYIYTIQPVRELVRNIDQYAEQLEAGIALTKKVDDSSITKAQVRRALNFARELDKLFVTMASTRSSVVTPEIALARLTLDNAVDEQVRRRSTIGSDRRPTLTKRESEPLTTITETAIELTESPTNTAADDKVMEDIPLVDLKSSEPTEGDVVLNGISPELAPKGMSPVNVEQPSSEPAAPSQKPPPVPPRPQGIADGQSAETTAKQQVERWAQQQDVREVVANILVQLRWAIKGDAATEKGEQIDRISKLFYGHDQVVTVKPTGEERENNPFLEVIAYLSHPCDIYSLLDGAFDASVIEAANGLSQYREIDQLPPILHISIERGQMNRTKCEEPLRLPEHIYMDRYMASSEMLVKRRQAWELKASLLDVVTRRVALTESEAGLEIPQALNSTTEYLQHISENASDLGIDLSLVDGHLLEAIGESAEVSRRELEEIDISISRYQQQLGDLFAEHRQLPYRLHAVFMHRSGQARIDGGHWFIYIYDTKNTLWRRYNDETVTKIPDPKAFLDPVKERARDEGTSSFVVYVREDLADELVQTVFREPAPEMQEIRDEVVQQEVRPPNIEVPNWEQEQVVAAWKDPSGW